MVKITERMIEGWCGGAVMQQARDALKRGAVQRADLNGNEVTGLYAQGDRKIKCRFTLTPDGLVENHCPCSQNQNYGAICVHLAAIALSIALRQRDPLREQRYIEEQRHARRLERVERIVRGHGGAAELSLALDYDWESQFDKGLVRVLIAISGGNSFSRPDSTLLDVLEDLDENGQLPNARNRVAKFHLRPIDFLSVLDAAGERDINVEGEPIAVHQQRSELKVTMDVDRENGELLLFAKTELPFMSAGEVPKYFVALERSWVLGNGHLWPVRPVLPEIYRALYKEVIAIPRSGVLSFIANELPRIKKMAPLEFEPGASPDFFRTEEMANPKFVATFRGSPASIGVTLEADYCGTRVPVCAPEAMGNVCVPDPEDIYRYLTRNMRAEANALSRLRETGFKGDRGDALEPLVGKREVLNVLGGVVPPLRRLGWNVEVEGKAAELMENLDMAIPIVSVDDEGKHFSVGIKYETTNGNTIAPALIERALACGESFFDYAGETILLDRNAVSSMRDVFADCQSREGKKPGHFELPNVYAAYVQSSLAALDGIDVEEPPDWQVRAKRDNREIKMTREPLGKLEEILRPYQKEGVWWLRMLERSGFGGILADEMGLGKTLQTLTWLSLPRCEEEKSERAKPSLIVAPTSLVGNWIKEAEKFTPEMNVIAMHGAGRHELWDELGNADLVVTSYALLRRDIERYAELEFAAIVLDEAQHIKNRNVQNAVAAKRLKARSRAVLTGTPVENGVADLWSIMDFLMPGYLGDYEDFKIDYEVPIAQGERDAEEAQTKLRRKLKPFLLRRLKRDVAKDLPDKIQKVSFSELTPEQDRVYQTVLEVYRTKIKEMVAERGFERCRMDVLAILLRLRQICCHLELLPEEMRAGERATSGKLEQFMEVVDEAIDSGHRILVFSQFTSMLKILRRELAARGIEHCYLDGATKNRMEECAKFNSDRSIPLFLISLKAGGTGLNLTGADMVVHFDPWWNPAVEDQATDRAHRIGQKRTVVAIKMIAQGTVEEKVLRLQQRKQAVIAATVGTQDAQVMEKLTWDDIKELIF